MFIVMMMMMMTMMMMMILMMIPTMLLLMAIERICLCAGYSSQMCVFKCWTTGLVLSR
jgi:hypothetical protein